jgi:hypothetical protein
MPLLTAILAGPEMFWVLFCTAASWFAGRNVAPSYPLNNILSSLYWYAPSVGIIISFTLSFEWKVPQPSWWLLVRLVVAGAVGVCMSTSAIVEKINAGSAGPGLAMGGMVAIVLHLFVLACAAITGIVLLVRSGNSPQLVGFLKQAAIVAAALVALVYVLGFALDRETEKLTGEAKARKLSRAHGEKIGAKFAADWRDGRKNWTNFEIIFVGPNSVRLVIPTQYGETTKPRDPLQTVAVWNGEVGAAFLKFVEAKGKWKCTWDPEINGLLWYLEIDMAGLTKNQFLEYTAEAARISIGPMARFAGSDTWWLFGEAIEAAIDVEQTAGSKQKFAITWLEYALKQASVYYQRALDDKHPKSDSETLRATWRERVTTLQQLRAQAFLLRSKPGEPDAQATDQLLSKVRALEGWKTTGESESGFAFVMNGSIPYVLLARSFAEQHQ